MREANVLYYSAWYRRKKEVPFKDNTMSKVRLFPCLKITLYYTLDPITGKAIVILFCFFSPSQHDRLACFKHFTPCYFVTMFAPFGCQPCVYFYRFALVRPSHYCHRHAKMLWFICWFFHNLLRNTFSHGSHIDIHVFNSYSICSHLM